VNSSAGTQPSPQVSAQTGAQVNSPTNAVYTATGAIVPSGQAVTAATGGSFIPFTSVAVPCPFGVSLSTDLTAFGCASDPLDASTYSGSHAPDSHAFRSRGIPSRIQMSDAIH
jgi:hypothetical protein